MDRPLRSDAVEGDISMLIYTAMIDPPREKRKFERLYHRYSRAMYAAAYSILQDPHRAEDAVHQAFMQIIDHLEKINEKDCHKTKSFLVTVVKNVAIDIWRKQKRENSVSYDAMEPVLHGSTAKNYETRDVIVKTINGLPENYRSVLVLKYYHGYDNEEIASILKISEDNVRQRISRGKKLLAERLAEEGIEV